MGFASDIKFMGIMKNAIIIHGTYGNPDENWFPWLKEELEKMGYRVDVPSFPTPDNQSLGSWMNTFGNPKDKLNTDSILIGHSLGAVFILTILESLDSPVKAVFLVSGFLGLLGNKEFDDLNISFATKKFNWEKIKSNFKKIYIYHSDNDPYIPLENAKAISKNLGGKLIVIKDAGHFNSKSGYDRFDRLLADIKNYE